VLDDRPFDPDPLIETLVRHEVEFVLIGGFAAVVRGAPFVTFDVDITPRVDKENLTRLSSALKELDARLRTQDVEGGLPFDHDADSLAAAGVWNLTTRYGDLDISFVPTGTEGFSDLRRDATTETLRDLHVLVASLGDIVRSKGAANRPKDQRALPLLRELLAREGEQRRQRTRGTQS
jgi:hypothetical protein